MTQIGMAQPIEIVPATREMIAEHYGDVPGRTMRAIAAVKDGRVIGVAGACLLPAGQMVFGEFTDELKAHPRAMLKGWKVLRALLDQSGLPAYTLCDRTFEAAERFLRHLGFEKYAGEIYVWAH